MNDTIAESPTLAQQTEALTEAFISQLPQQAQQIVGQSFEEILSSTIGENAVNLGDKAPNFILANAESATVQLSELVKKGPVVLSFYRGGWCPFCNLEFKALIDALPEIQALGAQLIGVSPETPDATANTVKQHKLPFEVLSDQGNVVTRDYGLLFIVPEKMRPLYLEWGLDIPSVNGDETWELPIPATYIINSNGVVTTAFVNKDYTKRMEPRAIIDALAQL